MLLYPCKLTFSLLLIFTTSEMHCENLENSGAIHSSSSSMLKAYQSNLPAHAFVIKNNQDSELQKELMNQIQSALLFKILLIHGLVFLIVYLLYFIKRRKKLQLFWNWKRGKKRQTIPEFRTKELLLQLEDFEQGDAYLNAALSLDYVAATMHTNVKYLSVVINKYKKENFPTYVNRLRIERLLVEIHREKKWRKLDFAGLGAAFGFNNARTFSDAFTKVTGQKPSHYFATLEKD